MYSLIHSFIHSFIYSFIHLFIFTSLYMVAPQIIRSFLWGAMLKTYSTIYIINEAYNYN